MSPQGPSLSTAAPSTPHRGRGRRLLVPGLLWMGVSGLALLLAVRDPGEPGHYPTCPFVTLTGLFCPGCGSTRSLADLVHGDLPAAFGHHPLVPPLLLGALWLLGRGTVDAWRGSRRPVRLPPAAPALVAVLVVTFTVLRNLPGWTWLSPA